MGSLSGRRVMVTSGGTREYIDDVRVVTNISSGALGAIIAEELFSRGAEVFYVFCKQAILPRPAHGIDDTSRMSTYGVVTVNDLKETMESIIKGFKIDTVIHSAAVSDFTFKNKGNIKLSSDSPEAFIEFMKSTITTTPKIIKLVKEWNPNITLVGFKFTVGKNPDELCEIALESLKKSKADLVVANDLKQMKDLNTHTAYFVRDKNPIMGWPGLSHIVYMQEKPQIAAGIKRGKPQIAVGIADFLSGDYL